MDNRPHFKPGPVKYTKGYGVRLFLNKLFKVFIALIALSIIAITIYIYVKQPVKSLNSDSRIIATQVNRMFSVGEKVLVAETDSYNPFTPIKRFLIPQDVYEAEIVAGPYGTIKPSNTENQYIVTHAKNRVEVYLHNVDQEFLEKDYVIRRIDAYGEFIDKSDRIVDRNSILGFE